MRLDGKAGSLSSAPSPPSTSAGGCHMVNTPHRAFLHLGNVEIWTCVDHMPIAALLRVLLQTTYVYILGHVNDKYA